MANLKESFQQMTSGQQIDNDSRYEIKYRLNHFQYLKIRNAIRPYMQMDTYTQMAPHNRYVVRSLYFDTHDYRAYTQKMNGDCERVKFRIRTYQRSLAETEMVRVEMKLRQGDRCSKKSMFVSLEEYTHFKQTRHWRESYGPISIEFERAVLTRHIAPVVLVEYDREGYQPRLPGDLRVTFDHHLRSAHADSLFPTHSFFQPHMPANVTMEVKFKDTLPRWMSQLVRSHGLKVIANSKYTQSIQIARHDLYHPENAILVR